MFDSGSRLSFISPKAREALQLQTSSKSKIDVKTFSNESNAKELHLVQVTVKSKDSLSNIYVKVFVNDICLPVEKQIIEFPTQAPPYPTIRTN